MSVGTFLRKMGGGHWNYTGGAAHMSTPIKEWEVIDVSGGNQTITINGGTAHAIMCDSDGTVLTVDTALMTNALMPTLRTGGNPYGVTQVYQTGTSLVGNVYAVAW